MMVDTTHLTAGAVPSTHEMIGSAAREAPATSRTRARRTDEPTSEGIENG